MIISLLAFFLSIALGIFVPIFAIPWLFILSFFGFTNKKAPKESLIRLLSRAAMSAAIALGVITILVLVFLVV
jgi:hypothetical protein